MPAIDVDGLATSTALSAYYFAGMILPHDVIKVLNKASVKFLLIGDHALGCWMRKPRATETVDILVSRRNYKNAVRVLMDAFPHLEPHGAPLFTRFRIPEGGRKAIEVLKAAQQPYVTALRHFHVVQSRGESYRIPSLEMALVMKFSAMSCLYRGGTDKLQDTSDFHRIVEDNPQLDLARVSELASHVYPTGGPDIARAVRRVGDVARPIL